jgi:hypothetical protein
MGKSNIKVISRERFASECSFVADKLNNLLTAIQLRAGMLVEFSEDERVKRLSQDIITVSQDAAFYSTRLRDLSDAKAPTQDDDNRPAACNDSVISATRLR